MSDLITSAKQLLSTIETQLTRLEVLSFIQPPAWMRELVLKHELKSLFFRGLVDETKHYLLLSDDMTATAKVVLEGAKPIFRHSLIKELSALGVELPTIKEFIGGGKKFYSYDIKELIGYEGTVIPLASEAELQNALQALSAMQQSIAAIDLIIAKSTPFVTYKNDGTPLNFENLATQLRDLYAQASARLRWASCALPVPAEVTAPFNVLESAITAMEDGADDVGWYEFSAGAEIAKKFWRLETQGLEALKYESVKGSLPVLKVPDPAFNITAYKNGSTGILSSVLRSSRVGKRQYLINEVSGTTGTGYLETFAWAMVILGEPEEYEHIGAIPTKKLNGIDAYSQEEYSTVSPLYYIPFARLVPFKSKRRIATPPGRRFGPEITLSRREKSIVTPTVGTEPNAHAVLTFSPEIDDAAFDNAVLAALSQAELTALKAWLELTVQDPYVNARDKEHLVVLSERIAAVISGNAAIAAASASALAPEVITTTEPSSAVYSVHKAEPEQITKAGLSQEYAPIHPGSKPSQPLLKVDDVLNCFHPKFLLRAPFIYLVGSLANNGQSCNDVDVLVKGPLDPVTRHIINYRLGRMLPPEISKRVSFLSAEDGLAGPFAAHYPLYDLAVIRRNDFRKVIEMSEAVVAVQVHRDDRHTFYKAAPSSYLILPASEGPCKAVLQQHIRGESIHGDFRVLTGSALIGMTIAYQIPGAVKEPKTMKEAQHYASTFNVKGSEWNKPFYAPKRVYATLKADEPEPWLKIEAESFPPGTIGATRNKPGWIVATGRPTVYLGERTPMFQEYFLENDPKLCGLLVFRLLEGTVGGPIDNSTPEGETFWTAMYTKNLVPSVLKRRAMEVGRVPPQGWSYLPPKIKAAIPKGLQYWHAADESERRDIRDALIKAELVTPETVRIVDYEFRLVDKKYFLAGTQVELIDSAALESEPGAESYAACAAATAMKESGNTFPFALSWQTWRGQVVVREGPSRDVFHLFIARSTNEVEDFILTDFDAALKASHPVACLHEIIRADEAAKLLTVEGAIEPGQSYYGKVLNATKATPSSIKIIWCGRITFQEDLPESKTFSFSFQPSGPSVATCPTMEHASATMDLYFDTTLQLNKEKGNQDIWALQVLPKSSAVAKMEQLEDVTLSDGTVLKNVQIWNPANITSTDDATHDRERVRPLALYQPMKPAPHKSNRFLAYEIDRLFNDFATAGILEAGLAIEPKYNGFRVEIQRAAYDSPILAFTEEVFERTSLIDNIMDGLPDLKKEFEKVPGPYIFDCEFMAFNDGQPIPRRDLASYRSLNALKEGHARPAVFDILYHPEHGNLFARPLAERRGLLHELLNQYNVDVIRVESIDAHSRGEVLDAYKKVIRTPGSEGMMLKSLQSTVTLIENDAWAKMRATRTFNAIVYDRHDVKDSAGVYNFSYAVGPASDAVAEEWETIEIEHVRYVPVGKTFNSKVDAAIGDTIVVEVTELLLDESRFHASKGKKTIRGFLPTVADKTCAPPATLTELIALVAPNEIKKYVGSSIKVLKTYEADDEHFIKGVVLIPDETDAHGDFYSAEDVRCACHWYMENFQECGWQHMLRLSKQDLCILENYITDADFVLEDQLVKKGTWMMAARVHNTDLWQRIKAGEITGWSMEGTALAFDAD